MRMTTLIILVLGHKILGDDDRKEHVHFKIRVPEIIKHHIHTKTVFIHVHPHPKKEPPKKKGHHYEESSYEDFNSWSSYDNYGNHEEKGEDGHVHKNGHECQNGVKSNNLQKDVYNSYLPTSYGVTDPGNFQNTGLQTDSNLKSASGHSQDNDEQGMVGYMYPPQYAIHEEIDDIPNNDIQQFDTYEEGYKRGLETETGHLITKNLKDFYDDKFNEAEDYKEDGYHNEYDKHSNDYHRGNYDKEISHQDRSGRKSAQKRYLALKMIIR